MLGSDDFFVAFFKSTSDNRADRLSARSCCEVVAQADSADPANLVDIYHTACAPCPPRSVLCLV